MKRKQLKPRQRSRARVPRRGVKAKGELKNLYFAKASKKGLKFIDSGCTPLNCVMGGGYPLHRVTNLIGDKSSGKTLQVTEAAINFLRQYKGEVHYIESEAAFDKGYAEAMGMPVGEINFYEEIESVEEMAKLVRELCDKGNEDSVERLVIVDSLDSLSSEAEIKREFGEATYGQEKAKMMSEMFRKLVRRITTGNVTVLIISQIRDKIGVTFGKKWTRSGGKALDFYASIVLVLADIGKRKRTIRGVSRPVGVNIRAKCDKNKVGLPFRECTYPIIFGYGVEDVEACLTYLKEVKATDAFKALDVPEKFTAAHVGKLQDDEARYKRVKELVIEYYEIVEAGFLPERRKY